jgi:DNA-binding NarL/FixJ family response regulator
MTTKRLLADEGIHVPGYRSAFWHKRVFKGIFTRGGHRLTVRTWSVRIQFQGRRRTFTLGRITRAEAALRAAKIYETIRVHGWKTAAQLHSRMSVSPLQTATGTAGESLSKVDVRYWKARLLRRQHGGQARVKAGYEFSTRIEYAGRSHYFPLLTADEEAAAAKAAEIYQAIVTEGWGVASQRFARELTLGFHWVANPLAWTYTTIHTETGNLPELTGAGNGKQRSTINIAIIEGDFGIRNALARCLRHQSADVCVSFLATGEQSFRELSRRPTCLALVNHSLPDMSGSQFIERLAKLAPRLPAIIYSVYEDSDQLFKSTPGGASGYLLKRTSPRQVLEPIASLLSRGTLSSQQISQQVRHYFWNITTCLQADDEVQEMGKLTPREKEILDYLTKGYLDKEIAQVLGISVWTVHGHLKNIFEKFQVHTRTEAVVKYLQK